MGRKMHCLFGEERRKALDGAERLEDFTYPLDLDGLTIEETEMARRIVEETKLEAELNEMYQRHITQQKIENYHNFLREVESLGISLKISKDFTEKNRLLKKYFGGRYETQGLGNYSADRLGRAFLGFLDYARKLKKKAYNK